MPPYLQKEIRSNKRLWPGDPKDGGLRGPQTWEESHKVVLEYEQREAAHRAVSHSVYSATDFQSADPRRRLRASRPLRRLLRKEQLPRPKLARIRRLPLRRGSWQSDVAHPLRIGNVSTLDSFEEGDALGLTCYLCGHCRALVNRPQAWHAKRRALVNRPQAWHTVHASRSRTATDKQSNACPLGP